MRRWRLAKAANLLAVVAIALATAGAGVAHPDPGPQGTRSKDDPLRAQAPLDQRLRLVLQPDQALGLIEVLERRAAGAPVPEVMWRRVFDSEGHRRLMERQEALVAGSVGFASATPSSADPSARSLRGWAESAAALDDLTGHRLGLDAWRYADLEEAGSRAMAYLPQHARIRATVYPLLGERTSSFLHDRGGERPAVFIYVDGAQTPTALEAVLAHELHHIGLTDACQCTAGRADETRALLRGFEEGVAVLAAAGGPGVDPRAIGDQAVRKTWTHRLDSLALDMAAFEALMDAAASGERGDADARTDAAVLRAVFPDEAFYSLGWVMASTIERELGRETLVDGLCRPERLLLDYDVAAARIAARDPSAAPPRWSDDFLDRLRERTGRV